MLCHAPLIKGGARLNTPGGAPVMSRKLCRASILRKLRNIKGGSAMIDDKRELLRALDDTINQFPTGRGQRNCKLLPRAACLAVKAGWDVETFADAIKGVAADIGMADINRTFKTATQVVARGTSAGAYSFQVAQHAKHARRFPHRVRSLIHAGRDIRTPDALAQLSPHPVADGDAWGGTITQMQWLFPNGNEFAYIFRTDEHGATPGVLGKSIMRANQWLNTACPVPPDEAGEQVVPNPFTGEPGETTDGRQSYIAQSCLAALPHMLMEFDELPMPEQCAFWAGFIRQGKLPLVCLVHSGGKSIHGCIRVNAPDLMTWNAIRAGLLDIYAADDDAAFRVDEQAMRPRTGMRLAGAVRQSTGARQRLLWACPFDDAMGANNGK